MNSPPKSRRKWLITAVKVLIVALVVYFLWGTVQDSVVKWRTSPPSLGPNWPAWLLLASVLYLAALLPEAFFWRRVLRLLGQDARLAETLRAYYIGHLGKYVPGKFMVIVIRAGLIRSSRVDPGVAAVSVFMSTFTMMSVAAFLAASVIVLWFRDRAEWFWASIGFMLFSILLTLPPVFTRLVRLSGAGRSNPAVVERLVGLNYRTLLLGWIMMVVGWGLMAAHLWALTRAMGCNQVSLIGSFHVYLASATLSVALGFVLMTPGGIGPREFVLTELLGKFLLDDPGMGLIIALLHRVVSVVSELVISGILYYGGRRQGPHESPSPDQPLVGARRESG